MLHRRFILRQLARSPKQALILSACIVLSLVALVALGGLSESVDRVLLQDARKLFAADIIIRSAYPLSPALTDAAAALQRQNRVDSARVWEFYSMARPEHQQASLLCQLKAVEPGYPFYGLVKLASKRPFADVLQQGRVIVDEAVLSRLGVAVGDRLHLGRAVLTIADVLEAEPDRPTDFFTLGPRIFLAADDLERLDLIQTGSRVRHKLLLKVQSAEALEQVAAKLRALALEDQEHVYTFRSSPSRLQRFLDNLFFFLNLIGIFILLLCGLGIQSALTALLREKTDTIAVLKTLGATGRFVISHFVALTLALGAVGTLLGILLGSLLQNLLPHLLQGLLPPEMAMVFSWRTALKGALLGILVVGLFAFMPLYRLNGIKPAHILRKGTLPRQRGLPYYASAVGIALFFAGMVLWQLKDARMGFYFTGGMLALLVGSALAAQLVLMLLKRLRLPILALRQAQSGLFRPGNATRAIIVTLAAATALLLSLYLIEKNLDAAFIQSYPPEAPNLFCVDIQPDQVERFTRVVGHKVEFYPIIRSRLAAINGRAIDREQERRKRGDNLARVFNLTYRHHLLSDERIVEGGGLYRAEFNGPQVSILDTVQKMGALRLGDRITFNIQGVPLTATVSSVRRRTSDAIAPYFYFVLPTSVLQDAPQTILTALRIDASQRAAVQNRIAATFPNVSVVDMSQTIATFSQLMVKLSNIIRFFTAFSLGAGLLIIVSSILATRSARIQQAVYYKILGAESRFIATVFMLENLLLGLISALLAAAMAHLVGWSICRYGLDIAYRPFAGATLVMMAATMVVVIGVGWLASRSILRQRPAPYLREQTQE